MFKVYSLAFTILFCNITVIVFAQNAATLKVNAPQNAERIFLLIEAENTVLEVCNLEINEQYSVIVQTDTECEFALQSKALQTAVFSNHPNALQFTAETLCTDFQVFTTSETVVFPMEITLSISRKNSQKNAPAASDLEKSLVSIQTDNNFTLQQLIEEVFIGGGCFEVLNVQGIGNAASIADGIGHFTQGMDATGLNEGVIISSGLHADASGPNISGSTSTDFFNFSGDPDLGQLATGLLVDPVGIEFDFVPTVDQISFDYVFASEEYCEFVNSSFNDVFGFFISGPGINGGFTFNGENIALLPDLVTPVAINSVNHLSNTGFFVSNDNSCSTQLPQVPNDIEYDGLTTVLTAVANVIPCEQYHIRLVVGDVGDGVWDSAVFLGANSFDAGGAASAEAFSASTGTNIAYEGCEDGVIVFTREGDDLSQDLIITYSIDLASTAGAGLDYVPIPMSITIPAGQTTFSLPVNIIIDNITEGTENIILLLDNPCLCSQQEVELIIEELPPVLGALPDLSICGEETITLDPGASGGQPGYTFEWSTGATSPTITVTPTGAEVYSVTITDACGNEGVASSTLSAETPPQATISGSGNLCAGQTAAIDLTISFEGTGPWEFVYTIDGVPQPMITTTDNPFILTVNNIGSYGLQSVTYAAGACPGMALGTAQVNESSITVSATPTPVPCSGENSGSISVTPSGGLAPYIYTWNNGLASGQNPMNLPAGTYTVTVLDGNGCEEETTVTIDEEPPLFVTINSTSLIDCNNPNGGGFDVSAGGGTPNYTYNWSDGSSGPNPTGLPAGNYNLTVIDANGCEVMTGASIIEDSTPPIAAPFGGEINCYNNTTSLSIGGSTTGGNTTYLWSGPGITNPNSPSPTVTGGGTYTLTVINGNNGCEASAEVTVTEDTTPPLAVANVNGILNCINTEIFLDGIGSSTGADYSYQWTGGGITSGNTTLNPTVNGAGTYTLTVTNFANGCEEMVSVNVDQDITPPIINPPIPPVLDCNTTEATIDISGSSSGVPFDITWTGPGITGGNTTTSPTVNTAGTYTITIVNTDNGCEESASFAVTQDNMPPNVSILPPPEITCAGSGEIVIDANSSDSGANNTIIWTGPGITGGANTTTPTVNAPGTYTITIINSDTGCEEMASVTISENIDEPIAVANTPTPIDCNNTQITLNGIGSSTGNEFQYEWTGGSITGGANTLTPTVDGAGTYTLVVTNITNDCVSQITVNVEDNTLDPFATILPPSALTCTETEVTLNGLGSDSGSNLVLTWTTNGGSFVSGTDGLTPIVNGAGEYILTITDPSNGCEAMASVNVEANEDVPIANAGTATTLNCATTEINLNGLNSSSGPDIIYTWTTNDGAIVSGGDTNSPTINAPGTYTLTVFNTASGCEAISQVTIPQDIETPIVDVLPGGILDCNNLELILDATNSSQNGNFIYTWLTTGGNIVSGANGLTPTINASGTYTLFVDNLDNNCVNAIDIFIPENLDTPLVDILPPGLLTCTETEVILDANNSDSDNNLIVTWTTLDGSIVSGEDGFMPTVNGAGTYTLTLSNPTNGCEASQSVEVEANGDVPFADAGPSLELTCLNETLTLNGFNSTSDSEIQYTWTTDDGFILNFPNSQAPVVSAPGTYTIEVLNTISGCVAYASVVITQNNDLPEIIVLEPEQLDCDAAEIVLDATGSVQDGNIEYLWVTSGGNIVSGENTLTPTVNNSGTYTLFINNLDNQCSNQATVTVSENFNIPDIMIAPPNALTCTQSELILDATGSSIGGDWVLTWTTDDGNIVGGADGLTPVVNGAGTYQLSIVDPISGCNAIMSVEVEANGDLPIADAGPTFELDCTTSEITLDGSNSTDGSDIVYTWTTDDGTIISGADGTNPSISAAGTYSLNVLNTASGCEANAAVVITENAELPEAIIEPADLLDCVNDEVTINAENSTQGADYQYTWTTPDGNIIADATTLTPTIDAAGTYVLTIVNTTNNCEETAEITIEADADIPEIFIAPAEMLTCIETQVSLDATGSSTDPNVEYTWTSSNGNIVTGGNTLMPTVDAAGTYELTITNTLNNCETFALVEVEADENIPVADAGAPNMLTCTVSDLALTGEASGGNNLDIAWTTGNGNIVDGATTLAPTIDAAGTYLLTVTNLDNDCISTSSVTIDQDIDQPIAAAGDPAELTCDQPTLQLNGTDSSSDGNLTYTWTTIDGNIVEGADGLTPTIDAAGLYTLTIVNIDNDCTSNAEVIIDQNADIPDANAGTTAVLGCDTPEIQLNGSTNSTSPSIEITWSTDDGNIVAGANDLSPTINAAGTYTLTIFDSANGCETQSEVEITANTDIPQINAGDGGQLSCTLQDITLNASIISSSPNTIIEWQTADGNIVSGDDGLSPVVDAAGIYEVIILDTLNACSSSANVEITQDDDLPEAIATAPSDLNCLVNEVTIDGTNSSQDASITYEWATDTGSIISGENSLTPTVNAPGIYTLTIIDQANDCTNTASVNIGLNNTLPNVALNGGTLTCATTSLTLDTEGSTQTGDLSILWEGTIDAGNDGFEPTISQAGIYTLTITNNENGCENSAEVEVFQDIIAPIIDAGDPAELTCTVEDITLSATADNDDYDLVWTTQDGSISIGSTTLTPTITAAGTYQLNVTNPANGCTAESAVTISQSADLPLANAGQNAMLNCIVDALTLNGEASMGAEFIYQWTTPDGNIVAGENDLNPTIDAAGIYHLQVINTSNECQSSSEVEILEDTNTPIASAGNPAELSCAIDALTLAGSSPNMGANIEYLWTTSNGYIVENATTLAPTINAPGTYTLQVLDTNNGCSSQSEVIISQDEDLPTVLANVLGDLTCVVNELQLDATGTDVGADFELLWTTNDGQILAGETTINPTISEPGIYQLNVVDLTNSCSNLATVEVLENIAPPMANAGGPTTLTCTTPTINLTGESDNNNTNSYLWTTTNGNIVTGETSLNPNIDAAGTYILEVTNTENGCVNSAQVVIPEDITPPMAAIIDPAELTCAVDELNLNAEASSNGANFSYTWTTTNGSILEGENGLNPLINAEGTYQLEVLNTQNGCTETAQVEVGSNIEIPNIDAGVTAELTCTITQINLAATGDNGSNFSYSWAGDGIVSGQNLLTPTIDEAGDYVITILNTDNGCSNEDVVTVTLDDIAPAINIAQPDELTCLQETALLTSVGNNQGNNFSYTWEGNGIIAGQNTPEATVNQSGAYNLIIVNTDNGCVSSMTVDVSQNMTLPSVDAGAPQTLACFEDAEVQLQATGSNGANFTYTWTTTNGIISSSNAQQATATQAGTYTLLVLNTENGCEASDVVEVEQNRPQEAELDARSPLCVGEYGSISFINVEGGTPTYSYSIDNGANFYSLSEFNGLAAGEYDCVIQDAFGCEWEDKIILDEPVPIEVNIDPEVTLQLGDTYQINTDVNIATSDISEIIWTNNSTLSCTNCLNPLASPLEDTEYEITVINEVGCRDVATIVVRVDKEVGIYVPDAFSPNGDGNNDIFLLYAKDLTVKKVNSFLVYSRWGETVWQYYNFDPSNYNHGWDGNHRGLPMDPAVFAWWAEVELIDGSTVLLEGDLTLIR